MTQERLQKILSRAGISSRRKAEELILAGKVKLNGRVVKELGVKADPFQDKVSVEGKPIPLQRKYHYYAYYKPRGVVVSKRDELGRKTLFDQLELPRAVNTVGRLDKDSEGLLLLSDDGDFVHRYTHPSYGISKRYQVEISRRLTPEEIRKMMTGVVLDNKSHKVLQLKNLKKSPGLWIEIELGEGVKREIRRFLDVFQVKVFQLIRVQHGSVKLGRLLPGDLKVLPHRPI